MSHLFDSQISGQTDLNENEINTIKNAITKANQTNFEQSRKMIDGFKNFIVENTANISDILPKEESINKELDSEENKLINFKEQVKKDLKQKENIEKELLIKKYRSNIYETVRSYKKIRNDIESYLNIQFTELSDFSKIVQDYRNLYNLYIKFKGYSFKSTKSSFESTRNSFSRIFKDHFPELFSTSSNPLQIDFCFIQQIPNISFLLHSFGLIADFYSSIWDFAISKILPNLCYQNIKIVQKDVTGHTTFSTQIRKHNQTPATFLKSSIKFYEILTQFLSLYEQKDQTNDFAYSYDNMDDFIISSEKTLKATISLKKKEFRKEVLLHIPEISGDAEGLQSYLDRLIELTEFNGKIDAVELIQKSRVPKMLFTCRNKIQSGQEISEVLKTMNEMLKGLQVPGALKKVAIIGLTYWKDDKEKLTKAIDRFVELKSDEAFECMLIYKDALEKL